jgi:hypothetical protein
MLNQFNLQCFLRNKAIHSFFRMGSLLLYSACFLLLGGSIDEPVRDKTGNTQFVNLAQFINQQTIWLDSLNPAVDKKVVIGGESQQKTVQNINWRKELELFLQADISKPALQAAYEIEEVDKRIRIFRPKTNENPNIQYLKIEYEQQTNRIESIEAHISQSNYLYHSERAFRLQCKTTATGQTLITSYWIKGFQKLLFADRVPFEIEARLL